MIVNIYELCAKPPEELTETDVALTVARLREMRQDHVAATAKGERKAGAQLATPDQVASLFKDLM